MEKNEYAIMFASENTYWWYRGLHELVEKYIKRYSKRAQTPLIMLDAGCGAGKMMEIARRYGTVEGFDCSPEALRFCMQRGLSNTFCQDLNTWTPPHEKYDIILCLDVLYHRAVVNEDEVQRKFFQALKPNGFLIENFPAFELLRRNHDAAIWTKKRYTRRRTVNAIQNMGFTIVCASYRLPFLFGIMLMKKISELIISPVHVRSDLISLPRWLNSILFFYNRFENTIIFWGIPLPLGGSLFIVGRKKGALSLK